MQQHTVDYKVLKTKDEILQLRDDLLNMSKVVFDCETTGLDVHSEDFAILGLGFTWKSGQGRYVAINATEHGMSEKEILDEFSDVLENENIKKIGQNIKYDALALHRKGITLNGLCFDTLVAHYCLYSDTRPQNLDDVCIHFFNIQKIKTKTLIPKKTKKNPNPSLSQVDVDKVGFYCCEDTDTTWRLYEYLTLELANNPSSFTLFKDIELPIYIVSIDMEKAGVYIDTTRLDALSEKINKKVQDLFSILTNKLGYELEISNTDKLRMALYEHLKIQDEIDIDIPRTEKRGELKTDKNTLKLLESNEYVSIILSIKNYAKLLSTFVDKFPQHISAITGCIHASFGTCMTSTGRWTSFGPNLQQIPNRDKEGREVREIFVSRWKDKGGLILAADYSQAELRILTHVSKDSELFSIYSKPDADIHTEVARKVAKLPEDYEIPKEKRSAAKTVNFGIIYGMGPKKLSAETGMSFVESKEFINTYLNTFSGVKRFLNNTEIFVRARGYTETVFGRKRYIKGIPNLQKQLDYLIATGAEWDNPLRKETQLEIWASIRQGQNHVIQGTCADILKLAMIKVHKELKRRMLKSLIVIQVHDEIVLDIYPGEQDEVVLLVKEAFETAVQFDIAMTSDIKVADNWALAH